MLDNDMYDQNYSIKAEKERSKAGRKKRRESFKREANFDEDGEAFKKAFDWQIMLRMLGYLKNYKIQLFFSIFLLLLYSAIAPIFPSLIARAVDRFIIANKAPFNSLDIDQRLNGLLMIVLLYIALKILNFGLRYGYTYLISWLGQHIIFDIRKEMFKKIQSMHLGYFDKTPVGRLITRITSDVDAVQRMITDGLVGLIADLGLLVGLAVYMLVINWQLALVTISVMPVLFFVMNFISNQIRNAYRAMRIRLSRSNAYLAENLSGMKTVQLFNREDRNQQKFDKLNLSLLDSQLEQLRWFAYFFPVVQFTGSIATGLILILSVYMLGLGNGTITIGIIIAFIQYSSMFFQPLRDLSDKINIMQAAMASSERIFSLLDTPAGIINKPEPTEFVSPFRGKIEFKNVFFAYNDDDWVLRDLSFTINPGESAAFVGHTGAGKTTIISLVSRFYDIQKGQILLDDVDLRDYKQRDLRKHVGIVLQDPFLFSGTIKSNISLDDDSIPMEQIIEAAKFVNAHDFISKLPQGYDTAVLERGAGFSTGQKQLIAFARTLVQNPDILLILDEATANIDTETEELIQDALKKIMQGRTSIVIAHRLSTIQNVDKIMVMSKGKLIEQGKHLELLRQNGYYRKLYELQYQQN